MSDQRKRGWWSSIIVAVGLLSILYVGTYDVLVRAEPLNSMSGEGGWPRVPEYSVGGEFANDCVIRFSEST